MHLHELWDCGISVLCFGIHGLGWDGSVQVQEAVCMEYCRKQDWTVQVWRCLNVEFHLHLVSKGVLRNGKGPPDSSPLTIFLDSSALQTERGLEIMDPFWRSIARYCFSPVFIWGPLF